MAVTVYNRQRRVKVQGDIWDNAFAAVLAAAGHAGDYVEVTFLSNRAIAVLNRQWRGKSGPTDCLSFPAAEEMPMLFEGGGRYLGEIVISLEQALIQGPVHIFSAGDETDTLYHEVLFLFIHSLLHLLGYDHETSSADEEKMFAEQDRIFRLVTGRRD